MCEIPYGSINRARREIMFVCLDDRSLAGGWSALLARYFRRLSFGAGSPTGPEGATRVHPLDDR
jgi:hypothetical protein